MDLGAAILGLLTGIVIKLAVMVLAGRFLVRLYRATAEPSGRARWLMVPAEHRDRFRPLTWGLGFFCVSELACGIEIYILTNSSVYVSCAHSITSAIAMSLTAIGVFEVIDWKLLHWRDSSKECVATDVCRGCTKRSAARCTFRPVMLMFATMVVFATIPVFFASTDRLDVDPRPYALPFESWNAWYDASFTPWIAEHFPGTSFDGRAFYLPEGMLVLEFRVLPAVGIGLAVGSIALMLLSRENTATTLLLAALGVVGYALFEALIYGLTRDAIIGGLLHEASELIFIVLAAELLQRMFRTPARAQA